jgi:DNA-binding HxlR family transcriptional regulator
MANPIKRLPLLPAERALKVISGRWKAIILYHLFGGPLRLSELQRLLPDVSQKMLIQQLREMEEHSIVHREVFREVPPRVEYSATALGLSFEPVLSALCEWGRHHAVELDEIDRLAECEMKPPRRVGGSSARRADESNAPLTARRGVETGAQTVAKASRRRLDA